jgi:Fe-S cluster assembly scaffold protein SufB
VRHFSAEAASALGGPAWLRRRRAEALERLHGLSQPTADGAEVWRYSPIDRLDLDAYRPLTAPAATTGTERALALVEEFGAASSVIVRDGQVLSVERRGLAESVVLGGAAALEDSPAGLGTLVGDHDFFVALNDAFGPDVVVVGVPPRTVVDGPIVIVHWCDGGTPDGPAPCTFPRTLVRLGEDSQAQVVEVVAGSAGPARALVVPVTEMVVEDRAEQLAAGPPGGDGGSRRLARHLHRRPRRGVRPLPSRRCRAGQGCLHRDHLGVPRLG